MTKQDDRKRVSLRLSQSQYDQIRHFAAKDQVSINNWILNACQHMVDFINADYDVPTASIQRQNQLVDMNHEMIQLLNTLIKININGFDAMSELMRGDNYLADDDDDDDSQNK